VYLTLYQLLSPSGDGHQRHSESVFVFPKGGVCLGIAEKVHEIRLLMFLVCDEIFEFLLNCCQDSTSTTQMCSN
jgi:hypothetical protein